MFLDLLTSLLGKERSWRLGRGLYMRARDEHGNAIASNGEAMLIRKLVAAHRADAAQPFRAMDIGANQGEWSQTLLREAGALPVALDIFEPVPATVDMLRANIGDDPRARIHAQAISDHIGTASMHVVGDGAGTNSLDGAHSGIAGRAVDVALTTLDAFLTEHAISRVDLVKIDAEGHDIVILRSLVPLLNAKTFGAIQFEYNWRWLMNRGSLREVFELIEGTPYRLARVAPGGPVVINRWNAELDRYFEANYALISDEMIAAIGARRGDWDDANVLPFG